MASRKQAAKTSSVVRRIKAIQARIAKERDTLRDLESEISEIANDCDEAEVSLSAAVEALSRLQ